MSRRLLAGGLAGGVVLLIWRVVFHAIIPVPPLCGDAAAGPAWALAPRPLLRELAGGVGAAMIATWILSLVTISPRGRLNLAAALGLLAWFTQGFPLWNWHGAPAGFVLAEGIRQMTGWMMAGGAIGWVLRRLDGAGAR